MFIAVYRIMVYVTAGAKCSIEIWDITGDNQRASIRGEEQKNKVFLGWSLIHFLKICGGDDDVCKVRVPGLPPGLCSYFSTLSVWQMRDMSLNAQLGSAQLLQSSIRTNINHNVECFIQFTQCRSTQCSAAQSFALYWSAQPGLWPPHSVKDPGWFFFAIFNSLIQTLTEHYCGEMGSGSLQLAMCISAGCSFCFLHELPFSCWTIPTS